MSYIKFKEITKYFNFNKKVDINTLPQYCLDYIKKDEKILAAYSTSRDRGLFTEKRIILFDYIGFNKQVHTIPFIAISTIAIIFRRTSAEMVIYINNGYPLILKFIGLSPEDKSDLRKLYNKLTELIDK